MQACVSMRRIRRIQNKMLIIWSSLGLFGVCCDPENTFVRLLQPFDVFIRIVYQLGQPQALVIPCVPIQRRFLRVSRCWFCWIRVAHCHTPSPFILILICLLLICQAQGCQLGHLSHVLLSIVQAPQKTEILRSLLLPLVIMVDQIEAPNLGLLAI